MVLLLARIITSPLLHMSILHIAFNMLAFVPIASSLERVQGTLFTAHLVMLLAFMSDVAYVLLSYLLSLWYTSEPQHWV